MFSGAGEAERETIARALRSTDGKKVAAAALLRISRKKLYAKIEKYAALATGGAIAGLRSRTRLWCVRRRHRTVWLML